MEVVVVVVENEYVNDNNDSEKKKKMIMIPMGKLKEERRPSKMQPFVCGHHARARTYWCVSYMSEPGADPVANTSRTFL